MNLLPELWWQISKLISNNNIACKNQIWAQFKLMNHYCYSIPSTKDNISRQIAYLKNTKPFWHHTTLMDWASENGHLEVVKFLHSIGADYTNNAMDYASRNGHLEVVHFLHSIDADYTMFAMDWASENGHLEVIKFLQSIGAEFTHWAMDNASAKGFLEVVKLLEQNAQRML